MDYRRRYAELTGDEETPYAPGEYGEGYAHSLQSIARAVDALEAQQGGQYDYTRLQMERYGPGVGEVRGRMYPTTTDAGYDRFFEARDAYRAGETGQAVKGLLGGFPSRPQRYGMLLGLIDYLKEDFGR